MSTRKSFKELRLQVEVLGLFEDTEHRIHDILDNYRSRLTNVVPTTGGENHSPTSVGEYRLVGTVLGCAKGEGFGIVSSPRRLRG